MKIRHTISPFGYIRTECLYPNDGTMKSARFNGHISEDACLARIISFRLRAGIRPPFALDPPPERTE